MPEELYSLSYVSRSAIRGSAEEIAAELQRLVDSARLNNERHGLTGALLYADECFEQVIEGTRARVEEVFERISTDKRHSDLTILHFARITQRTFADLPMTFSNASLPTD